MIRMAVISKDGVPEFGPTMPVDAVFKKGEDFRNFFYVKCNWILLYFLLIFYSVECGKSKLCSSYSQQQADQNS
jgi:hypothetical protein